MVNQPIAEDKLIDRRSVLRTGAALAAAGPALLHGAHAKAQPRPSGASPMAELAAKYPSILGPAKAIPGSNAHPDGYVPPGVERPKFVDPVSCAGIGARNVPGKNCCPTDYAWHEQNRMCRLASSFRPEPVSAAAGLR